MVVLTEDEFLNRPRLPGRPPAPEPPLPPPARRPGDPLRLEHSVLELALSVRSANCLLNDRIETVGALVSKTPAYLLGLPNFGRVSLREIQHELKAHALFLMPMLGPTCDEMAGD